MTKSTHIKNTWSNVRSWRKEFTKKDVDNYPILSSHEELWAISSQINSGVVDRDDDEKTAATPIEAFMYLTEMGFQSPPEILMTIRECFETYFAAGGTLSLEEVFFGREKPSIGNYASRQRKSVLYKQFSIAVSLDNIQAKHQKIKRLSLDVIAENMFQRHRELIYKLKGDELALDELQDNFPDTESFLRGWRRWKNKKSDK